MPPAPGKIEALPVKVLYTIDTSPQSFLAVLQEKQDVYVHPSTSAGGDMIGSCALKALVRGICFASPECVPNQSSLDFAVYNLDPVARSHQSRPNGPPTPFPVSLTGKGFLSWALAESGAGSTLARGRLVREYEFAATSFVDGGGGLEGLVAAAANAAGEEKDGRGWGLEVTLTLRQLNPEGKSEFGGRKSFETMLAEGKSSASTNLSVTSPGPVRAAPAAQNHGPPQMFARPVAPLPKTASPLRHTVSQPTVPSQPSAGRPLRQVLPAPPPPKTEPPRREAPGSPTPTRKRPYPSSPLAGPPVAAPRTPPRTARDRDHRTPPPRPVDTAPPRTPASPTRATLIKLLKSEGKMSPEMAKRLAQNDFLQKLMKALPPGEVSEAVVSPGRPIREIAAMSSIPPSSAPASEAWAPTPTDTDACYNCKATETVGQWMRKKLKDGSLGLVCNPCGLYFNMHKKMRPQELWGSDGSSSTGNGGRVPPVAVRSSPRLNRVRQEAPPPVPDSPRRRQTPKTQPPPSPSPRRSTRAAAREAQKLGEEPGSPSPSTGVGSLDFSSHFPFSSSVHNTPRASRALTSNSTGNGNVELTNPFTVPSIIPAAVPLLNPNTTASAEELESLFLQFADDDAAPQHVPSEALSLESLFGDGDTDGIMELLRSIEAESSDPPSEL